VMEMLSKMENTRVYPKVSGLATWSENWKSLCHYVQLYRYFVSQSNEFCRHNPLYCFSTMFIIIIVVYFVMYSVRKLLDTPSYLSILGYIWTCCYPPKEIPEWTFCSTECEIQDIHWCVTLGLYNTAYSQQKSVCKLQDLLSVSKR
jgi:hypothetical protein